MYILCKRKPKENALTLGVKKSRGVSTVVKPPIKSLFVGKFKKLLREKLFGNEKNASFWN